MKRRPDPEGLKGLLRRNELDGRPRGEELGKQMGTAPKNIIMQIQLEEEKVEELIVFFSSKRLKAIIISDQRKLKEAEGS